MRTLASMQQEKNQLLASATEMVTRGLNTSEQKQQYRELLRRADVISEDIAAFQTIESGLRNNSPVQTERSAETSPPPSLTPEQRRANRERAYRHLFKHGYQHGAPEQRDLQTSSDAAALIQQDWQSTWTAALKQYGPLGSMVRLIVKSTGTPTKTALVDPTGQSMTYQAETGSVDSMEADPSVSSVIPATDTLVSFTKSSVQLYDDAEIEGGLEGFIRDNLLGIGARSLETAILSGVDGSGTALPNNPGFLSSVTTGATTASATAITFSEMLALYSSPDASYRNSPGAAFYASQTTHDAIAGILDSNNRPIFHFDDDGMLRVFGKPVYVAGTASGMPSIGTASKPVVLFGDFSRAAVAVQRPLQTRVLTERFIADTMEIGFVSHMRVGSAAGISSAVKALVTAS